MRFLTIFLICAFSLPAFAQDAAAPSPVPADAPPPVAAPGTAPGTAPAAEAPAQDATPVKTADQMQVERVTSLATPAAMPMNSVFMLITNNSNIDDRLIAVKSARTKQTSLHMTDVDAKGVVSMREVESIAVPAGKMTVLPPMGDHVMLMGLTDHVQEKSTFPITLVFEKAGEKTVPVEVVGIDEFSKRFPRELMGDAVQKADDIREKLAEGTEKKSWTQKLRDRIRSLGGQATPPPAPDAVVEEPALVTQPEPSGAMQTLPTVPPESELPDPSSVPNASDIELKDEDKPAMPAGMDHSGH